MLTAHHVYQAFRAANVPEAEASAAAEEVAEFARIREDLGILRSDVSNLKWMFGITWTLLALILGAVVQLLLRSGRA